MAKRNPLPLVSLALSTEAEVAAVLLGLCSIQLDEDSPLASVAEDMIERIVAALPPPDTTKKPRHPLRVSASPNSLAADIHAAVIAERGLRIAYSDRKGADTRRTIWPVQIYSSGEEDCMVLAWCEARNDFRNFRTSRIRSTETLDRYPVRRQLLLARWAVQQENKFS